MNNNIRTVISKEELYPKRLLEIKKYPENIFAIGNLELLNTKNIVGIVGSRKCTEYGRKVAFSFAKELSKNGICIVSGMAIGIDTAAHDGAIEEKGKTIAILGSGLNCIYPKENEWLFNKILKNDGCILSEYAINEKASMKNFPKRNKIISGLSDIILVVEAAYRSGSTITARYAKEQKKMVCAIPSNIDSNTGTGTNRLLQQGAKLITNPNEIIELLKNREDNNGYKEMIPEEYLNVYKLLEKCDSIHINELAKKLKTTVYEITPMLTIMEIEGYIIQKPSNYFRKRNKNV